ncbi:magnesium/cobalt transporter CorA [bacterium]|nr:magnesium/cobalt transporter CorA [bacterium]
MPRFIKKVSETAGLPPGTIIHVGERKADEVTINLIDYDINRFDEKGVSTLDESLSRIPESTVTWININGIHNPKLVEEVGSRIGLHSLLLEDIANTEQRPKMEDYQDYLFFILKMFYYDNSSDDIKLEQVSIVLGGQYVLSFQEVEGDVFNSVRERIRGAKGRIRNSGSDYLAYALIDAIVDSYFQILEKIGDKIENMEEELISDLQSDTLRDIHGLKRDLIFLRRSIWPLREVISTLQRQESPLIHESTGVYLRDLYDHTIQVIDTIETFRDMVSGILDTYLSSLSNRMNEVMKVLTIIATIFIPLTFIAGIYGMNFRYMPELEWPFGYFAVLGIMFIVALVMVLFFRKKRWL